MNFLAHFQLAWPDPQRVAGGLEGDYYKGPLRGDLPSGIEQGVRLHRAIDAFTDSHAAIGQLRREFPTALRRYAGILIDLSFDHYLSKHWARFCDIPLEEFNAGVYRALRGHAEHLSEGSRRMLGRLEEYDILGRYADWDTVPASAARIGQRFRRGNPLLEVEPQLAPVRAAMEQAFLAFYPELQAFCASAPQPWNQSPAALSKIAPGAKSA